MPKRTNKIKVAGYIRVSTTFQAKEGESLAAQEEAIKKYAKNYEYELVNIFKDEGISGAKDNRPGLNDLRKNAEQNKFEKVIFNKLTRFGRNSRDLLNLFEEFQENYKTALISIKENIDTSSHAGKLMMTVLAGIAEFERDTIKEQMEEGKLRKLKRNEIFLGIPGLGYLFNKNTKKIEVVPEEKKLYLKIVDLFLTQKLSLNKIALYLNRSGKKSPRGKKWSISSLSYILKNEAYTGKLVVNKFEYSNRNRKYEDGEKGKKILKLKSIEERINFPFPRFIDKTKWNQIQKQIQFNKIKPKREKDPNKFLFSGMINCGLCGSKVSSKYGAYIKKDKAKASYYACYYATRPVEKLKHFYGKKKCLLPYVRMEDVDTILWGRILSKLVYPKKAIKEWLSNSQVNKNDLSKEHENIKKEIKKNEKKMRYILEAIAEGKETVRKEGSRLMNEINDEIENLKDRESHLETQLQTFNLNEKALKELDIKKYKNELSKCLFDLSGKEKKRIIQIFMSPESGGKVVLKPKTYGDIAIDGFPHTYTKTGKEIESWKEVEPREIVTDLQFDFSMEKVFGVYNYLKSKGLFNESLVLNSRKSFGKH